MAKSITIVAVDIEEVAKGQKTYQSMSVAFKGEDGKVDAKKLVSFATDKLVWDTLAKAKKGDTFSVDQEKNEAGFWTWTAVHRQDGPVAQKGQLAPMKPTYETPEERAKRQVMIVRQSSISSAVELVKDHGKQPDPAKVIEVAKMFEAYVLDLGMDGLINDALPE